MIHLGSNHHLVQSELQNLKIWLFGGTSKLPILVILDFKPIYFILIYSYLAHIVFQERTKHYLHEFLIRIAKFEN